MKKQFWQIVVLMLLVTVFLSACSSETKQIAEETVASTEAITEATEPEIELDPEWISEATIDEAYACLFSTDGKKNVKLAQEILLPLVEAGNAEAQYYWAYIHDWEIVDNNGEEEKECLYWHNLAMEQGFAKSYLAASSNGYIESEEQKEKLAEMAKLEGLFEMTPEELGADGCQLIGSYYNRKKDYNNAFEWFLKAADMGSTVAMNYVGVMYYNGEGVAKDIAISLEWLEKAANLGEIGAMYNLVLHYQAYGSDSTAANWCKKASDLGHANAMYLMGCYYYSGFGVKKNLAQAQLLFEKAANAGNATAMYWTGWLKLENSNSSEQEINDGMAWCMKAYANGQDGMSEYIDTLLKQNRGVNGYFENYGELISVKP